MQTIAPRPPTRRERDGRGRVSAASLTLWRHESSAQTAINLLLRLGRSGQLTLLSRMAQTTLVRNKAGPAGRFMPIVSAVKIMLKPWN